MIELLKAVTWFNGEKMNYVLNCEYFKWYQRITWSVYIVCKCIKEIVSAILLPVTTFFEYLLYTITNQKFYIVSLEEIAQNVRADGEAVLEEMYSM